MVILLFSSRLPDLLICCEGDTIKITLGQALDWEKCKFLSILKAYCTLTAIMALLGGCLILTTWPQDPKPSSPRCSRSCMLLKYRLPSTVMMPVSLMISCSLASISACFEFVEQLVMFMPAKSKFRLTLVGVPFGCRGTEGIYKDKS